MEENPLRLNFRNISSDCLKLAKVHSLFELVYVEYKLHAIEESIPLRLLAFDIL